MALDVPSVAAAVAIAFACAAVAHAAFRLVLGAVVAFARWNRQAFVLRGAPMAPGYVPLLGHTIALFKAVGNYPCTWDLFSAWSTATAPKPVRVQIFTRHCVVIADPSTMRRVMSTNLKNYNKDLEFSYAPFLEILGTGLVTRRGDWRRMRGHISKALRVEILDEIIAIANRGWSGFVKLDDASARRVRGHGKRVPAPARVIGEAILSLQPGRRRAVS